MSTLWIILLTLVLYSFIATVGFIVSGENEDVAIAFGLGIFGLTLLGLCGVLRKIIGKLRNINKRSIFENRDTGEKFKCKLKYTHDIEWLKGYKLVRRYADKSEWECIPDFSEEFIINSKRNCDNCKHDKECTCDYYPYTTIKCKHDEYGRVLEFDEFEEK